MSTPTEINLTVNSTPYTVSVSPDMPLLWVLRDELGLTGTKYGCGIGSCGACTVLLDEKPVRSCLTRVGNVSDVVTTIEGLRVNNAAGVNLLNKWIEHQVAQCGYCQPGQIVSATALLARNPQPDEQAINSALAGNLCRCGTYERIREAILSAAASASIDKHSTDQG